jgi:hypothetical protein
MNRRAPTTFVAAAAFFSIGLGGGSSAQAEQIQKTTDGVYGRFDGDLDLSIAAGAAVLWGGSGGAAVARALFLDTAGIYAAYNDAFGNASSGPPRSFALGIGMRPLFLPRWGLDLDRGPAILDLTLDAITIDLGVLWSSDAQGRFTDRPGLELAIGTEVPLIGEAAGPWIGARGALRWRASELSGSPDPDPALGPAWFFTFAWHFIANVHLADLGDASVR